MNSKFYVREIDPLYEDMPSNGTMLDVFECFEEPCDTHKHFPTLETARKEIRDFKIETTNAISSDKVMSFSESGYYYKISGDLPTFDEVQHFSKFLELKLEDDFDSKHIETICDNNSIKLVYFLEKSTTGNGLNPMVYDNIIKVEDELKGEQ